MREFILAFLCGLLIAISVRADEVKDTGNRYTAGTHRFGAHPEGGFERFVLEFHRRGSNKAPQVNVRAQNDGGAEVRITGATLAGNLPNNNDLKRLFKNATLFGGGDVDMDGDSVTFRFSFRTSTKDVKAMWIQGPDRLVVDVFGDGIVSRSLASRRMKGAAGRGGKPDFFCFPAQARLEFTEALRKAGIDGTHYAADESMSNESIVCYPGKSQILATVRMPRSRGVSSEPPPAVAANNPAPAMPPAPTNEYTPTPIDVKPEDRSRYWIAPYLPSADRPALKPMDPPEPRSGEPALELGRKPLAELNTKPKGATAPGGTTTTTTATAEAPAPPATSPAPPLADEPPTATNTSSRELSTDDTFAPLK